MGFLSKSDVAEALQAGHVRIALLIEAHFVSQVCLMWTGVGEFTTRDGARWSGMGEVVGVTGLDAGVGLTATQTTVTLSGALITPDLVRLAANNRMEIDGRDIRFYAQIFSGAGSPIGDKFALKVGRMTTLEFAAEGPTKRIIRLGVEGRFVRRRRPVFGWYTHYDQQQRFPLDMGLEFTGAVVDKTVTWPDY